MDAIDGDVFVVHYKGRDVRPFLIINVEFEMRLNINGKNLAAIKQAIQDLIGYIDVEIGACDYPEIQKVIALQSRKRKLLDLHDSLSLGFWKSDATREKNGEFDNI